MEESLDCVLRQGCMRSEMLRISVDFPLRVNFPTSVYLPILIVLHSVFGILGFISTV
jgi:hypothetical protein